MKKMIAMVLVFMMVLSLAACGENQKQNGDTKTNTQEHQTSKNDASSDIDSIRALLCNNEWGDWYYHAADAISGTLLFYRFLDDGTIASYTYEVLSHNRATHKFTYEGVYTINSDGTITTEIGLGGKPTFQYVLNGQNLQLFKNATLYQTGTDEYVETELYNAEWLEKIWGNELGSSSTND